jgi:hypothetical protein
MASVSNDRAAMVRSPKTPSGQAREAPGSPAMNLAVPATPELKVPATEISTVAAQGTWETRGTAAVPRSVTGATSGEAMTFAASAYVEN